MDETSTYVEPRLADLGDMVTATLGSWEMGEDDPLTKLRVDGDT